MRPLLYVVFLILLSACSTAVRTTSPIFMGIAQVEKPPFTILELSVTPWIAGREEGGTGYLLELILTEPFATLDSVTYKGNSVAWKRDGMQVDRTKYTANIREKTPNQRELILDKDPTKEYGNTPPNRSKNQVAIYYRYRNKQQVYIHTKIQRKEPLLYM